MLVLKDIFGGSLEVTSENKFCFEAKNSLKIFLGQVQTESFVQASKRHININFFVRLVLGRPRVCPGISPGLSLGQIR